MAGPSALLEVVAGKATGMSIVVEDELVVGRNAQGAGKLAEDDELSRSHARIAIDGKGFCAVEDLGSTNGTFVDGARIAGPTLLGGGAQIRLGTSVIAVEGVLPVPEPGADNKRSLTRVSPAIATTGSAAAPHAAAVRNSGSAPAPAGTAATATLATAPTAPAPLQAVGEFRPPAHRRQPGLASRSWIPVALSFGTVVLVAIALVVYFSQHT
jgi:pSer/pThr/pTyr-binding forkhead associated (FHA) protein